MPHLRSRVMQRLVRPCLSQAPVISELLLDHLPSLLALSTNAWHLSWIVGRSRKMWLDDLMMGVELQILQRGLTSSVAFRSLPQPSHWSPRAS